MLIHRRITSKHCIRQYPFADLGEERHCESKVSHPEAQPNDPSGLEPRPLNPGFSQQAILRPP